MIVSCHTYAYLLDGPLAGAVGLVNHYHIRGSKVDVSRIEAFFMTGAQWVGHHKPQICHEQENIMVAEVPTTHNTDQV